MGRLRNRFKGLSCTADMWDTMPTCRSSDTLRAVPSSNVFPPWFREAFFSECDSVDGEVAGVSSLEAMEAADVGDVLLCSTSGLEILDKRWPIIM